MKSGLAVILTGLVALCFATPAGAQAPSPDTGISGVYEVIVGARNAAPVIEHFGVFGFRVVKTATGTRADGRRIYGVDSAFKSYRLQNGPVDSHGLLRILEWEQPLGPGVGYAPPETIGQRMAVMRTRDIIRIKDVFDDLRHAASRPWLPTEAVFDDLYDLDEGEYSITNRRVGVREMAVYGQWFVHVFFQRYGYTIPGYGRLNDEAPLAASEFTHHDFFVRGDMAKVTRHYVSVLGFRAEGDPEISGDWQKGPRGVFLMEPGESHWYQGFVSPNNICGKLKFFIPADPDQAPDRSARQRVGEEGITLHSLYTPRLDMVHGLAAGAGLEPTGIGRNEFGERGFLFTGPDGVTWQILDIPAPKRAPVTKLEFQRVDN